MSENPCCASARNEESKVALQVMTCVCEREKDVQYNTLHIWQTMKGKYNSVMMDTHTLTNFQHCHNNYPYSCHNSEHWNTVCTSNPIVHTNQMSCWVWFFHWRPWTASQSEYRMMWASCVYTAECLCGLLFPLQILSKSQHHSKEITSFSQNEGKTFTWASTAHQ